MKKSLFFLALGFCSVSTFAQKVVLSKPTCKYLTYVKGDTFEGVIVSKDFCLPFLPNVSKEARFTPSLQEIEAVEKLLAKDLKSINFQLVNQGKNGGPVIHENLSKYARQYYGYITQQGEHVVFVSNLWGGNYKSETEKRWKIGAVMVFDGSSNYWQVRANLSNQKLFGLNVNGSV